MEWLNLPVNVTRTDEYADSEPVERATWFNLLAYCASLENSGRIVGCREWKSRKWEQMAGVTAAEVGANCKLWTWDGDDLLVAFYPAEAERKVQAKSSAGRLGGLASGMARRKTPLEAPAGSASSSAEATSEAPLACSKETERKETEQNINGREGNGMEGGQPAPAPGQLSEIQRFQQAVNMLSPAWRKMAHWSAQDEHALHSALPNLRNLEEQDWLVMRWYFRWVSSSANQTSRDPERLTTRRSIFLDELASHLERANNAWRSGGRPRLDEVTPSTQAPAAAPNLPDFSKPAEAAAYFRTLITKPAP